MAGIRHNEGKARLTFLPYSAVALISEAFTFGADKYSAHNWMGGLSYTETADAIKRHIDKWLDPAMPDEDEESGISHLAHAGAGIIMLCYFTMTGRYDDFDDRATQNDIPEHPAYAPLEAEVEETILGSRQVGTEEGKSSHFLEW